MMVVPSNWFKNQKDGSVRISANISALMRKVDIVA